MRRTSLAALVVIATLLAGCLQKSAPSFPENPEVQKLIVDACLADRPSLAGYRGVVNVKSTAPDFPEKGQVTVYADVFFDNGYGGTRIQLGYIDHFVLYKDENKTWRVQLVKKKD